MLTFRSGASPPQRRRSRTAPLQRPALFSVKSNVITLLQGKPAKYPEMSSTRCVAFEEKALILPLFAGTIAMFEVIAPSNAFNVDTNGCGLPWANNVRKPSVPCGTTVAFKRYDRADACAGPRPAATSECLARLGGL